MAKFVVGTVDEIPPGGRKIVEVGGRSIGVFNVGGEFFALLNRCPHQGGPLCAGNTLGFLRSAGVGEFVYSRPGEVIRCPWHGWEYDVRTGQSWFDPRRVLVRRYEVTVEPGEQVAAELGQRTPPAEQERSGLTAEQDWSGSATERDASLRRTEREPSEGRTERDASGSVAEPAAGAGPAELEASGLQKGPFVAETYPVTVEKQYVLVEIGR